MGACCCVHMSLICSCCSSQQVLNLPVTPCRNFMLLNMIVPPPHRSGRLGRGVPEGRVQGRGEGRDGGRLGKRRSGKICRRKSVARQDEPNRAEATISERQDMTDSAKQELRAPLS